ncbi:hypothetical protein RSSM_02907 [Rhodopirellula sallentina SM41]|uniref:Uncharacterized protein n=1 Tax=Rhodopirellula sallentina SM41 TaxID=1263870 RepID=M5U2D4_9BACT|nr:hypothetical protein RSSM_02907 [Rhodopirellula sallentina SM41]
MRRFGDRLCTKGKRRAQKANRAATNEPLTRGKPSIREKPSMRGEEMMPRNGCP